MTATRQTMAHPAPAASRLALAMACGLVLACIAMLLMRGLGLGGLGLRNGSPAVTLDAGADTGGD